MFNKTPYRFALLPLLLVTGAAAFAVTAPASAAPTGKAHVYKKVGERELKIYVTEPKESSAGQRPSIVFFHGGGWVGGKPGQFTEHAKHYAKQGVVCFQVEYRLLDKQKNDPPTVCIQDAKSAMRWVRSHAKQFRLDPKRVAAAGGSAGGHLAAFVGMGTGVDDPADPLDVNPRANLLVLFNPVFDNGPGGWGTRRVGDKFLQFSPAHQIDKSDPPTIVFLGTRDKLIPVSTAERFQKNMRSVDVDCELHLYEGQAHGFFNVDRADGKYYRETVAAADRFLAKHGWLKTP